MSPSNLGSRILSCRTVTPLPWCKKKQNFLTNAEIKQNLGTRGGRTIYIYICIYIYRGRAGMGAEFFRFLGAEFFRFLGAEFFQLQTQKTKNIRSRPVTS